MTVNPQDGEWYLASDGNWYCWPDPTPYSGPPTAAPPASPPTPPAAPEPAPDLSWLQRPPEADQALPTTAIPATAPGGFWAPDPFTPPPTAGPTGERPPGWVPEGGMPVLGTPLKPVIDVNPIPAYALIGFGVLLAIASLLPWIKITGGFAEGSENGIGDGFNGVFTMVMGGLTAAAGAAWLSGGNNRRPTVGWSSLVSGLLATALVFEDYNDIKNVASAAKGVIPGLPDELTTFAASAGFGVYLAMVAAIGIAASGVALALIGEHKR